jgi:hypothetical protein
MASFTGALEQENARLTAALRRARRSLEEVAFDPDADEETLREALHEARRALTNESVRESSADSPAR